MDIKRKGGLKWMLAAVFGCFFATADAQVTESLKAIGMENIRCVQTPGMTTVSFENNVYRSSCTGVGKAIDACLGSKTKGDLQLVVLKNLIPKLCITCHKCRMAARLCASVRRLSSKSLRSTASASVIFWLRAAASISSQDKNAMAHSSVSSGSSTFRQVTFSRPGITASCRSSAWGMWESHSSTITA